MTFADLGAALNELKVGTTPMKFAHFAWQSAPPGDYGVYGEDGADQFQANNRYAEHTMHGSVDWFTRTDDESGRNAIETLFKTLQETECFAWYLNTIQYEYKTNFLHYEWIVELA